MTSYRVSYLDALQGGSGQVLLDDEELALWLVARPGVLIKELEPQYGLADARYQIYREARDRARVGLFL